MNYKSLILLTSSKSFRITFRRAEKELVGKTHYNNLARIKGLQQLGFSVLAFDYRGYRLSKEDLPKEF